MASDDDEASETPTATPIVTTTDDEGEDPIAGLPDNNDDDEGEDPIAGLPDNDDDLDAGLPHPSGLPDPIADPIAATATPAKRGRDDNLTAAAVTPAEDDDKKPRSSPRRRLNDSMADNTPTPNEPDEIKPYKGMPIRKDFDGEWYDGSIASDPYDRRNLHSVTVDHWKVIYEDGDKEDMDLEEIKKWTVAKATPAAAAAPAATESQEATTTEPPKRSTKKAPRASYSYETTKKDLCYCLGVTEVEVTAALNKMKPPYGLNKAMRLIHQAKTEGTQEATSREKFAPKIGLPIRKALEGSQYHGKVTKDAEILEVDGQKVRMWEVTYDDGDKEDLDFFELMASWAGRSIRTNPARGRQLCFLELFSGCGAVTQEFAERKWRVRSIDNDERSCSTDKVDIMKLEYLDIGMVPDVIWASPPCFTYSLLAGGKHRDPKDGQFEKTPEAHQNNRYFVRMAAILRWAKGLNPHLIVIIENPVGLLSKMPLMQQLVDDLCLHRVTVNYCAFGREDKKPTQLWTNVSASMDYTFCFYGMTQRLF